MKKTLTLTTLCLVLTLAFTVFFAGCTSTRVPAAKNPPLYSQEKITAVDHWDNIAIDVAERVRKTLLDRKDLIARPIYIRSPEGRGFVEVFSGLLQTELVSRGMQVSQTPEPGCIYLDYTVQLVDFDGSREGYMPSLASVGIGLANLVTGKYTTASDHEVIVNVELVENNRYAMHLSKYYYINDDDWGLYVSSPGGAGGGAPGTGRSSTVAAPDADGQWSRYAKRTPAFCKQTGG